MDRKAYYILHVSLLFHCSFRLSMNKLTKTSATLIVTMMMTYSRTSIPNTTTQTHSHELARVCEIFR